MPSSFSRSRVLALVLLAGVLALALGTRLLELRPTYTSDEGYWMQRTLRFGAALARGDLGQTYRSGHPGVTTMWVGLAGVGPERLRPFLPSRFTNYATLQQHPLYLDAFTSARKAVAVVSALLLIAAVALAWRLLGAGPALTGGALLALDPYQVGSAQLLHVDTLLAPLMLVALLSGLNYWLGGRQVRYLVLTGVLIGLSVLTKAPGIALPMYLTLVALVVTRPWNHGAQSLLPWVGAGALALVVYMALWPAMWVEAPRRIPQLIRFAASVGGSPHNWPNFFLGQPITGDPGILFYPLALLFRISPVVLLGLLALVLAKGQAPRQRYTVVALVGFVFFFVLLMNIGAKKFDRYLLPGIAVLTLLGGAGLWWTASCSSRVPARAAVIAVPLLLQSMLFWQAQPYPLAAYNPLVGGIEGARRVLMVGWGEGLDQVAEYLNLQPGAEQLVAKTHYHHALRPLFHGRTVRVPDPTPVHYFVVYVNMAQRVLVPPTILELMQTASPEHVAYVNGSPYAWVYRVDRVIESAPSTEDGEEPDD